MASITNAGNNAEQTVISLTGATKLSPSLKTGDINLSILPGQYKNTGTTIQDIEIEIKEANGGTANQVRADRYLVLVIHRKGGWYVIPPHKVLELIQDRTSQHGGSQFSNTTISVNRRILPYKINIINIKNEIIDAFYAGQKYAPIFINMIADQKIERDILNKQHEQNIKHEILIMNLFENKTINSASDLFGSMQAEAMARGTIITDIYKSIKDDIRILPFSEDVEKLMVLV